MTKMENYFKGYVHISDTYTREMSAEEFIQFAQTKGQLIKESRFVPAPLESDSWGKFIVVINDGNYHIIWPNV